jgi:ligand-binding sensor domain-containing protein/DNA-binding CsgD family transcriptional regulator
MRVVSVVFIAFFGVLPFHANSQSNLAGVPSVRNFSTQNYGGGIQNWDIAQDKRGLVYIANNFGLLEFDGSRWQIYRVKNGSKMRSVAIDDTGKIFVGCQGDFGYFFPDGQGQLQYVSLADSLPDQYRNFDETWNVFLDEGKVYFCTFSNIFIFEHEKFSVVRPVHALELSFFVNREVYVDERDRGITQLNADALELMEGGDFFRNKGVSSILPHASNRLIISTFQQGVFEFNNGIIKPWQPELQAYFKEAIVNVMVRLKNGNFAVGTQNHGLLIVNDEGRILVQLTSGKGLQNRTVLSIFEDDLQNLWIGQNNGLAYIELGSPFTFINEQVGLPGTGYAAYLDNNKLYVGTNTGLYVKDASGKTSAFKLVENTRGQVYHIGRYGNDLLMGHHNGSFRIEDNKSTLISTEPGAWIFLQLRQNMNALVEGSYNGLQLLKKNSGHWAFSHKLGGFKESSRVMEQDRDGTLWITHGYKGVYKIMFNDSVTRIRSVDFYGANKGFPSNVLINVFNIRNELIFTSENGIYKYDKKADRFVREPFFTSLLGENAQLWHIREDAFGNIYFTGRDQIGVLRKNTVGNYALETNSFNKIRGFLNDDLENMIVLENNEVLFGAKEGFVHYDPNTKVNAESRFKTHIRRFSTTASGDSLLFYGNHVSNRKITESQSDDEIITLPYTSNSVNFTFSATSFEGNGEVVHQYYLEKFEKNWSEWTPQTQKEYTNLREGKYTFHVRSRNVYGEISKEMTFRFTIRAPWYRAPWAYLIYVVTVTGLLYTGFGLLDRKHKHEKRLMNIQQQKELIRKDNEMELLAQKNQEEITRLKNEKLEAELMHMNKELGTSTVLILNKNEFISGVKDNLRSISKKSTEEVSKELSRLVRDIETNLSSDHDWEHFQLHFDNVHGDFSRRFRAAYPVLSPQDMKLSAYLRMNLSTKEIAHLLNISVRGVEISRYRLRKKLQLDRKLNLQEYILNF